MEYFRYRVIFATTILVVVALESFGVQPLDAQVTFELVITQKYGWMDVSDAPRPLSAKERALDGGVLGIVTDIKVDGNGRLYVADPSMHKVVVFNRDGSLAAVWGGRGNGPGEMQRPRSIALSPTGVFVLDMQGGVAHAFTREGVFQERVPFPTSVAVDLEWANGLLWSNRHALSGQKALIAVHPLRGHVVDSALNLSAQELDLLQHGGSPRLYALRDTLYVTSPIPGIWWALSEGRSRKFGRARFPEARGYTRTIGRTPGVQAVTDQVIGFAVTEDGAAIIAYEHRTALGEAAGQSPRSESWLEIVERSGASRARVRLANHVTVSSVRLHGQDILLGVVGEVPEVWRVRVTASRR